MSGLGKRRRVYRLLASRKRKFRLGHSGKLLSSAEDGYTQKNQIYFRWKGGLKGRAKYLDHLPGQLLPL